MSNLGYRYVTFFLNEKSVFFQSLDEFDDEDVGEKDRREEEELVQANTFQNEAMTSDPSFIAVRSLLIQQWCEVFTSHARGAECMTQIVAPELPNRGTVAQRDRQQESSRAGFE